LTSADNLALAAALIFLLGFRTGLVAGAVPLILAHLALAAAAILARPAALIFHLFRAALVSEGTGAPSNWLSSPRSASILSLMSAARLSCRASSFDISGCHPLGICKPFFRYFAFTSTMLCDFR
jgi:hypothetical protein